MDDWVVKLRDPESKVDELGVKVRWESDGGEVVEGDGGDGGRDGFDVFVSGAGFKRCRRSYEDDDREFRVVGVDEFCQLHHGNQVSDPRRRVQNHRA